MHVAFINENTLGHTSHVPRFVQEIKEHPEWGCVPHQIDATPLPPALKHAERGIRGLHRLGLDGLITRWRRAISLHAGNQLAELARQVPIEAVVVNTQSAGLDIPRVLPDARCHVALDATFEQLAHSPWFGPTRVSRWLHPLTLRWLRTQERRLFQHAHLLLPWATRVRESLIKTYGIAPERIDVLPPSMRDPGPPRRQPSPRRRILFVGGDFHRKGGAELLEAWRNHLKNQADLDVITRSTITPEPGLQVHRSVEAGSAKWLDLWTSADLFIFPSHLETFGIVLLEAMAFGVPILAARTGAADDIIQHGTNGMLLPDRTPMTIGKAALSLLLDDRLRSSLASAGRCTFEKHFDLTRNSARLVSLLQAPVESKPDHQRFLSARNR